MGILSNGKGSLQDLEKAAFRERSDETIIKGVCIENEAPIEITGSVTTSGGGATTPVITNIITGAAGVEGSHAFAADTQRFLMRTRGNAATMQISFVSGESGTKYFTIPKGATFNEEGLKVTGLTVYFQLDFASQTIEIMEWS